MAVHGGTADRTRWAPVAGALAERFTLYLLDRRGRGASLEESRGPYALAREAEDVACIVASIGEAVLYLGHSYGALVGMEALLLTDAISRALLYEPPFDTPDETIMPEWQARLAAVHTLEREGRIGLQYRCDPERYVSLRVPVRFLVGECSPAAFKAASAAAAAAIPGSELVELPGQAHTMIDGDPQGFVEHVLDFFGAGDG